MRTGFGLWAGCAAVAAALAVSAAPALAGEPATVTGVVDGDTLTARTDAGAELTVDLIGIDAPELRDCGGRDARAALREVAGGQAVALEADPAVPGGFYADRTAGGGDVGIELVRRGWARVVQTPAFARLDDYLISQEAAAGGVWALCDGDFHLTPAERRRALARAAKALVRRYYRQLSGKRFRGAWRLLGAPARRQLGGSHRRWRRGHRRSLGVRANVGRARAGRSRAVVTVRLRTRDRDACSGRAVAQRFRGRVVVAERRGRLQIVRFRIRKTGGRTPRTSKSQCPKPKPSPSPPATDCQGYNPCIPPGPDVDCAGGSGDGPRYVEGPIRVTGSDPYGLDGDGDGIGCQS